MTPVVTAPAIVLAPLELSSLQLETYLTGYWSADQWDLGESPLLPPGKVLGHIFIAFDLSSKTLATELKYACWRKFSEGRWSPLAARSAMSRVRAVIRFIKQECPDTQSLLERDLAEWLSQFRAYLEREGVLRDDTIAYIDQTQNIRHYLNADSRLSTLSAIYRTVLEAHDLRPEYERDVWDVRKMGATLSPADQSYRLDFTQISQVWLRQTVKRYLRYRLAIQSLSNAKWTLLIMNEFSAFLAQRPQDTRPADVNRTLIVEYIAYLASKRPTPNARLQALTQLRLFLETCAREGWADFPEKRLIFDEDLPRKIKALPRPIPEDVLDQLNRHLPSLSEPYHTMLVVLQECGMRLSELCALQLDCLTQDQDGDWFLRYFQWKMKKEHVIPITHDLAAIIQIQQQAVQAKWGAPCAILFPNERGRPLAKYRVTQTLNRFAVEKDIRDATGHLFRFKAHAFRHTVATRMLRSGVKQHHVQKYLGHESPEMTLVYAQITDQDLKKAFQEYRALAVDITGKMVITDQLKVDSADLQWFKKNIMAQALPHGFCALPAIAEPCPVPNACLTCANFRTNASFLGVLRAELAATETLIHTAQANNWTRQVEMNDRVAVNLHKIIDSLEISCPGIPSHP